MPSYLDADCWSIWSYMHTIEYFVFCIPLNVGAYIIVTIGLIYGIMALFFLVSVSVNYEAYKSVYVYKIDQLYYFIILFCLVLIIFVASIILLVGVLIERSKPVLIYIWSICVHLILNVFLTLGVTIYCCYDDVCFDGSGFGGACIMLTLTFFYSVLWSYFIYCVNSYRLNEL